MNAKFRAIEQGLVNEARGRMCHWKFNLAHAKARSKNFAQVQVKRKAQIVLSKTMIAVSIFLGLYVVLCVLIFVAQEKLIFFPQKLNKDHVLQFSQPFEEIYLTTKDNKKIHGLHFKADSTKGLVFYLHGNAGSLEDWGEVAQVYLKLNYDVFLLDYRGYGKSEGSIKREAQLHEDVQTAYDYIARQYDEQKIVVLGYSIGTGLATKLASANEPRLLILQAPYYSLTDVVKHTVPFVPSFLLKYKLETCRYITQCKMPVKLIHGDQDEVIYYGSSLKLKMLLKPTDILITLEGQGHNGMTFTEEYFREIRRILE